MWGTQAAVEAITDPRILNEVAKETQNAGNVAFVVKTRIVNGSPTGPELDINNKRFIQKITQKQNSEDS